MGPYTITVIDESIVFRETGFWFFRSPSNGDLLIHIYWTKDLCTKNFKQILRFWERD